MKTSDLPASSSANGARLPVVTTSDPVLYFTHIPKTGGVTLKAWLENQMPFGTALVMEQDQAAALPAETLQAHRLFSGHYCSEVIRRLARRPDLTFALVREPWERFQSWSSHSARLRDAHYSEYRKIATRPEVFDSELSFELHQAHWLWRALHGGVDDRHVPEIEALPALIDELDLVAPTSEIPRLMQLIAFVCEWTPPPAAWHINRAPKPHPVRADAEAIKARLAVDYALFDLATAAFWSRYTQMLDELFPGTHHSPDDAKNSCFETVQDALRRRFEARQGQDRAPVVQHFETADAGLRGEGWWWREKPLDYAYRWSGPATTSSLYLPAVQGAGDHLLVLEFMAVASNPIWESLQISLNGFPLPVLSREFNELARPHEPKFLLCATVPAAAISGAEGVCRLDLKLCETSQVLRETLICESRDTVNPDLRAVGVCLHSVCLVPNKR